MKYKRIESNPWEIEAFQQQITSGLYTVTTRDGSGKIDHAKKLLVPVGHWLTKHVRGEEIAWYVYTDEDFRQSFQEIPASVVPNQHETIQDVAQRMRKKQEERPSIRWPDCGRGTPPIPKYPDWTPGLGETIIWCSSQGGPKQ
jgi:hypothetical protein